MATAADESGFPLLAAADVPGYVSGQQALASLTGEPGAVELLADGKLNAVYLVRGSQGSVVLKQGLPWVRIYPDWPLSAARTSHEARVYGVVGPLAGSLTPQLIGYDERANVLALEAVADARPWSDELSTGSAGGEVAAALGRFSARLAYGTSEFGADQARRSAVIAQTRGSVLSDLMARLVFRRPFEQADAYASGRGVPAERLRTDAALTRGFAELEERYLSADDALIHGDLHIASVLVAPGRTVVVDFEFAKMGPAGFDPGLLWGNLLLAAPVARARGRAAGRTVAEQIGAHWDSYVRTFTTLAAAQSHPEAAVDEWLRAVEAEAIGYAGCEIIRRLTGGDLVVPLDGLDASDREHAQRDLVAVGRDAVCDRRQMTAADLAASYLQRAG